MEDVKIKSINDIKAENIYWAFWQCSDCYDYQNGYLCLLYLNNFRLYKTFKMHDGKTGINKLKPVFTMNICKYSNETSAEFNVRGIYTVYRDYLLSLIPLPIPECIKGGV